jgi:LmbE family N-acetylglucosaminyl deacetylase
MAKDDKKKKGKRGKKASGDGAIKPGTTPPVGSAQQEAPSPHERPAKAMVIMAHPDDADFTSAGTVAKWCAEGWEVIYVLVTGGDKGTHDETMHPEKLAAIREQEQREACKVLGVKELICLGYPDGFVPDDTELRGTIVRLLRLYRPDVVVTWDAFRGSFNHRDHRNVGRVTMDAVYPVVRDRLFYQHDEEDGLASHQVNEILLAGAADPDYTVDVTDFWETKVNAILCHTSQIGGRTREEFIKDREERDKREGPKPVEERFRRWSIRRPPRQQEQQAEQQKAADGSAATDGVLDAKDVEEQEASEGSAVATPA